MIDKKRIESLLNQLDAVQKQIDAIHAELLTELSDDELTAAERQEIESIRKENDFRTFEEWEKEKPLD
jgi:DNA-binding FrmR family transcriptional regulator